MNIFLTGFMGSGKSALGKKLAARLDRPFLDLDELVESAAGKSIADIFSEGGEEAFRELERKELFQLSSGRNAVISLGGGACCSEENWSFIRENGMAIYLREKSETLFGRLKKNRNNRPLIKGMDDSGLKTFISELLEKRERYYNRAEVIYEKEKTSFSFLARQLTAYLR